MTWLGFTVTANLIKAVLMHLSTTLNADV